jgi:hypothetical protein
MAPCVYPMLRSTRLAAGWSNHHPARVPALDHSAESAGLRESVFARDGVSRRRAVELAVREFLPRLEGTARNPGGTAGVALAVRLQCTGQPGHMSLLVFDQGLTITLSTAKWRTVELISLLLQV